MRVKNRLLSLLLSACLIAGLLPATALASGTGKALQKGAACISGYNSGWDYIYYGTWDGSPMEWRVLSTTGNGGTYQDANGGNPSNGVLFLLSEKLLGTAGSSMGGVYFDKNDRFFWQGSDAQGWCKDFAGESGEAVADAFTTAELDTILKTTKSDEEYTYTRDVTEITFSASENILNGDRVFFLSAEEAGKAAYGLDTDRKRVAQWGGEDSWWWLRSYSSSYVGEVVKRGYLARSQASTDYTARPAFNLNADEVLLTSAAVGGKPEGFNEVSTYSGREWKLTLIDKSRAAFTAKLRESDSDGKTYVSYSGATTGANEYVSALIVKSDLDTISYYGRLKNVAATSDASGEVEIDLTGKMEDGDKLYIFNEQYNGDKKTDYSSPLCMVKLPSEVQTYTISFDANGGTGTMNSEKVQEGEYTLPENGFTAPAGKHFTTWAKDSTDGSRYDAGRSYNVSANTTFYAIWEDDPVYSILADVTTLDFGQAYDTDGIPTAKTVTITNTGNQPITLAQPAEKQDYTIGTLSKTDLAPGETATFTVQPKENLSLGTHNETITVQGTSGSGTASVDIKVSFELVTHTTYLISVSASPAEGGTVTGGGTYAVGAAVTVKATPNSGYRFVEWTENGTQVSTSASYLFLADSARKLVAVFEKDNHVWSEWVSNGNGTHSRTCAGDENHAAHTETDNCSGGTATCVSAAECTACKALYGEKDMNNHTGGTEVRGRVEATTEKEGYTGDTYCLGCKLIIATGQTIPKKDNTPASTPTTPVTAPSTGSTAPAESPKSEETEDNAPTYVTYTVKKGDTLGALAKKYGYTVAEIMEANSDLIKKPNRIYVGWQIKIPQAVETSTENTPDAILPDDRKVTAYIVKKGDTLWAIARKHGCTIAEILALNEDLIADPSKIFPGWELKIPQD